MLQYTEREVLPNNVFVFGCGGTGSRTIPPLIQLLKSQTWLLNPNMYLIDGDVVEPKNCSRQHFIEQDVGKNKAAVIAERYSKGFGVDLKFYPHFFEGPSDISVKSLNSVGAFSTSSTPGVSGSSPCMSSISSCVRNNGMAREAVSKYDLVRMYEFLTQSTDFSSAGNNSDLEVVLDLACDMANGGNVNLHGHNETFINKVKVANSLFFAKSVVILCVDSAEARRKILSQMKALHPGRKMFVIDAGNEDIYGQVSFFRSDHVAPLLDTEALSSFMSKVRADSDKPFWGGRSRASLSFTCNTNGIEQNLGVNSRHAYIRRDDGFSPRANVTTCSIDESQYTELNKPENNAKEGWFSQLEDLCAHVAASRTSIPILPKSFPDMSTYSGEINLLPIPDRFYDTLQDGESTRSCADLDQTLAINNLMAAAIVNVVNNLVYSLPFTFNTIRISLNGGYSVDHMSHYWYKNMLMGNDARYSNSIVKEVINSLLNTKKNTDKDFKKHVLRQLAVGDYSINMAIRRRLVGRDLNPLNDRASYLASISTNLEDDARIGRITSSDAEKSRLKDIGKYLRAWAKIYQSLYTCTSREEKRLEDAVKELNTVIDEIEDIDNLFTFAIKSWVNNLYGNNLYNDDGMSYRHSSFWVALVELSMCLRDDVDTPVSSFVTGSTLKNSFVQAVKDSGRATMGYISKGEILPRSEVVTTLREIIRAA